MELRTAGRRARARVLAFAVVVAPLGGAAVTLAEEHEARGDEPPIDALAASLKRFDEGRAAFEAKRYDEARAAFEASNRLQASPNSLLYIARCFRETGKLASAYVTFKRSAREAEERRTATLEKRFAATRDAANAEAAEIERRVPRLVIAVPGGLPPDFAVTIDGKHVPQVSWGLAIETDPGSWVVEAKGRRMKPFRAAIDLAEGDQRRIDVAVERVPTATLRLAFPSRPAGMAIELDGAPVDPREATDPRELDVGHHELTVRAPSYLPFRWDRSLANGERADVRVDLVAAPPRGKNGTAPWLFVAAAGGTVAALGVATGLAVSATSLDSSESAKNPLLRDPDTQGRIRTRSSIANVLFVSGAVLGASALVLFFTTTWGAPPPKTGAASL